MVEGRPVAKASAEENKQRAGVLETFLGARVWHHRWLNWIRALPEGWRIAGGAALIAAVVFVPYVGAVGLWDPWETHYGEVGRQMIVRADYVYPVQDSGDVSLSGWFFSKPPLTMWIDALGMLAVGIQHGDGKLPLYTEWAMRLPFALMSAAALGLLAWALSRTVNRRVGLTAAFALATMPLYFLISRQAVTDTPFIAALVAAMGCAIIGLLDTGTRHRAAWWYAFYVLLGLSTLSKGLLGVALPAVILVLYAAFFIFPWTWESFAEHVHWLSEQVNARLSWLWRKVVRRPSPPRAGSGPATTPVLFAEMGRMHFFQGVLVFLAVALPWYLTLSLFPSVDSENKTFFYRFFIHDHFNRLMEGVHTTTPGGTFIYFIEQGGFAMFPWVALVPGALALVTRIRLGAQDARTRVAFLALAWSVVAFFVVGISATKFHHYVLPVLPGVAVLVALFVDELWEDGIAAHGVSLLLGLVSFILVGKDLAENPKNFTDLFVYNYDRPYPFELDARAIRFGDHILATGDVVAAGLLAAAAYFFLDGSSERGGRWSARVTAVVLGASGLAVLVASKAPGSSPVLLLAIGLAAAAGIALYLASREKGAERRSAMWMAWCVAALAALLLAVGVRLGANDPLILAVRQPLNVKMGMGWTFGLAGVALTAAAVRRARVELFASFCALSLGFALWFSWSHWVDLSHHWTQRDLFWRYYDQRRPDEPIAAYFMDWKGETFYSRNTVRQDKDSAPRLTLYGQLPGRKWALVEQTRLGLLRQAVGADKSVTPIDRNLNVKFVLVTIE
jgi:4-amino-4-deoxy-L-arabinose transferase-like glycosyltransferase